MAYSKVRGERGSEHENASTFFFFCSVAFPNPRMHYIWMRNRSSKHVEPKLAHTPTCLFLFGHISGLLRFAKGYASYKR